MTKLCFAATVLAIATASVVLTSSPAISAPRQAVAAPTDFSASFMAFDRRTGESTVHYGEHKQHRSASIVKLLIALDYLETKGPDAEIPSDDLALLQPMLRASNDTAASILWVRDGWETIVQRMAAKLDLGDTAPPANRRFWGYTAISAFDVVKIYRYILETANPKFRDFIMSNLHQSTKCADDGWDQSFGIPRAVRDQSWGVKQGWSGFGDPAPEQKCVPPSQPGRSVLNSQEAQDDVAAAPGEATSGGPLDPTPPDIDLTRRAMHTSGTIGTDDDKIVVVLTLEPVDTTWEDSSDRITALTKDVYLAGCTD